jgi:nucleoside-diphosphate-sugar epimerase
VKVIVIGTGTIGSAVRHSLVQHGHEVAVVTVETDHRTSGLKVLDRLNV